MRTLKGHRAVLGWVLLGLLTSIPFSAWAQPDGDLEDKVQGLAEELARLRELPADAQLQAFFHGWTRKEALLKAVGVGLTVPLNQVVVTLTPGEPARLLRMGQDSRPEHELQKKAKNANNGKLSKISFEEYA